MKPSTDNASSGVQINPAIRSRLTSQRLIVSAATDELLSIILEQLRPTQIDKVNCYRDEDEAAWVFTFTQQNRSDGLMKHVEPMRAVLEGLGLNHVSVHHSRAPRRPPYTRHSFSELRVVVPFRGNPQIHEVHNNG